MRAPGDILLVSCYELGHQPFQLAMLLALLRRAGYVPVAVDTAVEALTGEAIAQARFVAISVPMHTALRLGQQVAQRVRSLNPGAHICFYGHYAWPIRLPFQELAHAGPAVNPGYSARFSLCLNASSCLRCFAMPG